MKKKMYESEKQYRLREDVLAKRRIYARELYARNPARAEASRRSAEKSRLLSPNKRRAQLKAGKAIAKGFLVRQPCEECGRLPVDAHHDDYSKPFEVRWLCRRHHQGWHRDHGEAKSAA